MREFIIGCDDCTVTIGEECSNILYLSIEILSKAVDELTLYGVLSRHE